MAKVKNPFIEALAKVAESQDISSFKKIFDYFSPRLKSFLMRSGADEAIAEEIIQETMTIIWTKADYYDSSVASPSTWIYTIARNKKIDILRKTRKAILEDIDSAILPPVESKADENIAIQTLVEAEMSVKTAIVMIYHSVDLTEAKKMINDNNGMLRKIIS